MDPEGRVAGVAQEAATELGIEFWDVEVAGHGRGPKVTVYADREGGITLDDLERLSERIRTRLDADPPFAGPYTLDVASPGPERRLRSPKDVDRFLGERAVIRLKVPKGERRHFTGTLTSVHDDVVEIVGEDGHAHRFSWKDIARAHLHG